MAPGSDRIQINIRLRATTKAALEKSAKEDLRTMADQADILIMEALEARGTAKKGKR